MKSKRNLIVPILVLGSVFSFAGSIVGSIAWYQYNTRTSLAFIGSSMGVSESLRIRIARDGQGDEEGWETSLTHEQISSYLDENELATKMAPITSGPLSRDAALSDFYKNPVRLNGTTDAPYSTWEKADKAYFAQIPLELKLEEIDTLGNNNLLTRDLYLADLLIEENEANVDNNKLDLSSAVRVHLDIDNDSKDLLISKNGGTINTNGYLSLADPNNLYVDGHNTSSKFGFEGDNKYVPTLYGNGQQTSYIAGNNLVYLNGENILPSLTEDSLNPQTKRSLENLDFVTPNVTFDEANLVWLVDGVEILGIDSSYTYKGIIYNQSEEKYYLEFDNGTQNFIELDTNSLISTSKSLGKLSTTNNFMKIMVTIWVEGWAVLDDNEVTVTSYDCVSNAGIDAFLVSFSNGATYSYEVNNNQEIKESNDHKLMINDAKTDIDYIDVLSVDYISTDSSGIALFRVNKLDLTTEEININNKREISLEDGLYKVGDNYTFVANKTARWSEKDYINSLFNVGIEFGVKTNN